MGLMINPVLVTRRVCDYKYERRDVALSDEKYEKRKKPFGKKGLQVSTSRSE